MESAVSSEPIFRFGLFEADVASHTLTRKGVRVRIQDKPFCVLSLLLKNPGKTITREELQRALWPEGTYVDFDTGLNVVLKKLRAAIDDDSDNPRFIETVPRRGYRFIAPVSVAQHAPLCDPATVPISSPPLGTALSHPARKLRLWLKYAVLGPVLLLASSGWYLLRHGSAVHTAPKVIAVLPFSNQGAGPDYDYLRYAIPDDLVTDLTNTRSVNVRPFSSTSAYANKASDPAGVGKELRVSYVVAGSFLMDQQNLRVSLELVDVAQNQAIWRDEVTVMPKELIALHDKLAVAANQRLLPTINVTAASTATLPTPRNEQAFDSFMHSLTLPLDPAANQDAIQMLQKSVSLDSGYAPAWSQLGWRYYVDYHYGSGGEAAREKSLEASQRESKLDPNTPPRSTTMRAEQGDLTGAYDQAVEFVRRRPDFSIAHFWMGYVLRYAGLVDEAGKECDAGLAIDPGFNVFRSCATAFILAGNYAHAQKYINVDSSSGFAALSRMDIALRTGDKDAVLTEANAALKAGYAYPDAALARACVNHSPQPELTKIVAAMESGGASRPDPEVLYLNAGVLSFCGQQDAALRELQRAIRGNYCSYPSMNNDPLFDPIRQRAEFAALRSAGMQCQQDFLIHRQHADASLAASR
jgi:TolB-like protein/DNA-binding winged helix-turn-helix (wHTH) protein